jgi:hypothetical protein
MVEQACSKMARENYRKHWSQARNVPYSPNFQTRSFHALGEDLELGCLTSHGIEDTWESVAGRMFEPPSNSPMTVNY